MRIVPSIFIVLALFTAAAPIGAQTTTAEINVVQSGLPKDPDVKAPGIDPKVLIGEWKGRWESAGSGNGGAVWLTFKKVEGQSVAGSCHMGASGTPTGYNRDHPFIATVEGDSITIACAPFSYRLTLNGGKMDGEFTGTSRNASIMDVKKTR